MPQEVQREHQHGPGCGHTAVHHAGHVDYLDNGHLYHQMADRFEEHRIEVTAANPDQCTPAVGNQAHDRGHHHGPSCGHLAIPHGDHMDYVVAGHLHHPHGDHCDDHGAVSLS